MKHKLLILTNEQEAYRRLIESANLPTLEMTANPEDSAIVLGEPSMIRKVLEQMPNLKWAQSIWAGIEPLLDPASRRDYILTNARGVFGGLMSEYIIGYLLAHERKIFHLRELQDKKHWDDSNLGTLRGKTIGLLGVGSIGAQVAQTAKFFGMRVRGYTRESVSSADIDQYFHGDALLQFANRLDYLVNILPNTKDTRKIINAELLHALPRHALFINVGRGSAVDEAALIKALSTQRMAAAVLDVFEQEPLPKEHPFWATPNCTITFHTAAPSLPQDITNLFIENYNLFVQNLPLKYQVNFEREY